MHLFSTRRGPTGAVPEDSKSQDTTIEALLTASGGRPVIQIVWNPETDQTSIASVGFDHAKIPQLIYNLGRVLVGEI